jgi:hypothetical protein
MATMRSRTTSGSPRSFESAKPKPGLRRRAQHLASQRPHICGPGSDGAAGNKPSGRYSVPLSSSCHALQDPLATRFMPTLSSAGSFRTPTASVSLVRA